MVLDRDTAFRDVRYTNMVYKTVKKDNTLGYALVENALDGPDPFEDEYLEGEYHPGPGGGRHAMYDVMEYMVQELKDVKKEDGTAVLTEDNVKYVNYEILHYLYNLHLKNKCIVGLKYDTTSDFYPKYTTTLIEHCTDFWVFDFDTYEKDKSPFSEDPVQRQYDAMSYLQGVLEEKNAFLAGAVFDVTLCDAYEADTEFEKSERASLSPYERYVSAIKAVKSSEGTYDIYGFERVKDLLIDSGVVSAEAFLDK